MAVAVDAVTTGTSGGNPSFSHTCTGANLVLYVLIAQRYGTSGVTAVTYNSVAMTLLSDYDDANETHTFVYRLVAPATGANTVGITQTDSRSLGYTAISCTGVDQVNPEGTIVQATGGGTAVSATVSSAVNDLVLDVLAWYRPVAETATVGAGQTQRQNTSHTTVGAASSTEAGAASVAMTWTMSAAADWNQIAVPVKAGGAGGGAGALSAALTTGFEDGN